MAAGRHEPAAALHERALAILEASVGADSPRLAAALNDLASFLDDTGEYAEAEELEHGTLTCRARSRRRLRKIAIMAFQGAVSTVIRQGHTALSTLRDGAALTTLQIRGEPTTVDQNETLFATLQTGGDGMAKWGGNDPLVWCRMVTLIDNRNVWQWFVFDPVRQ